MRIHNPTPEDAGTMDLATELKSRFNSESELAFTQQPEPVQNAVRMLEQAISNYLLVIGNPRRKSAA